MNLGIFRVKNEARWIKRCVESILPLCDSVLILDDHSTDDTAAICAAIPGVTVYASPFEGMNEARDKNWLLEKATALNPEWIVAIDGDEMLSAGSIDEVRSAMRGEIACLSLRVLYLWDREDQVRVDRVYGDFHRESIFKPNGSKFVVNAGSPNFHCGNVPWGCRQKRRVLSAPLLHFGYLHKEDRIRKWRWYNSHDAVNLTEGYDAKFPERGSYPWIVQGDIPQVPADAKLMHAGPLELKPLELTVPA